MQAVKSGLTLSPSTMGLASFKQAWQAYRDASAQQAAVRESVAALAALDDAALADIGIHRSEIVSVAKATLTHGRL
jgi:uncharacterized protein YjiS (DUF1127 family)